MTRSEILSLARKVLKAYGFKPIKNKFYLDLEEVFIVARVSSWYGGLSYALEYNFAIKAIHDASERTGDMFTGYDLGLLPYFFNKCGEDNLREMPKETFEEDLIEMLERYITPFKTNALEHILNARFVEGKTNNMPVYMITKKSQQYLGVDYSKGLPPDAFSATWYPPSP